MSDGKGEASLIKDAVIDKVQLIVDESRKKLETINCSEHGQALKKLDFDRTSGRFKIESCCDIGDKLLTEAIEKL